MRSAMHRPWWRAFTLLAVVSMVLAACGGTDSGTASPPAASADTAPASIAASEPAEASVAASEPAEASVAASEPAEASEAASEPAEASEAASEPAEASAAASGSAVASAAASGSAAASAAASSATEPAASTAAGGEGPTLNADVSGEVDLWHFWGSPVRRNAIRRVIAICQQQLPNITVTETFKPFGDIYTAHLAAVAAGTGMADVIVEDRPQLPARAAEGVDQNLQEFATRDGITGEEFWPFAWQQTLYEDETYGIPYETDVRVLYYNKTAFKDAGLDPEKPPTTWDELLEYADKLDVVEGDTIERMAFSPLIGNSGPDLWGATNGFNPVSEDGSTVTVNSPENVETLEWIKTWLDRYGGYQNHQNFRANFAAAPNDPFMSGKVAMHADINGYSSQINAFRPRVTNAAGEQVEMEWGVAPLPNNGEPGTTSGGFALSIPSGAENVDAGLGVDQVRHRPRSASIVGTRHLRHAGARRGCKRPDADRRPELGAVRGRDGQFQDQAVRSCLPKLGTGAGQLATSQIWTGEVPVQQALDEAQEAIEFETGQ